MLRAAIAIGCALGCLVTVDASAATRRHSAVHKASAPATPAATQAHGPDLVVLANQTVLNVNPKGCDVNEELISGTVAIKNQGDAGAERLASAPIVSVYIPEMLDMKDDKLVPNALEPMEIFETDVHIGKGESKAGRGLVGNHKVYITADPYNKIAESNEQNNLLIRTMTFNCK